jgi:uncharacterized protein YqeY
MVRDELKAMSIAALKARDKETRTLLSGMLAKFLEVEKSGKFEGWTEEAQRDLIARHLKQLIGSAKMLAGTELAAQYQKEIDLLAPFGPQLLDEAATRAILEPLVGKVSGVGPVMGRVMSQYKGKVDPGLVRRLAQEMGLL